MGFENYERIVTSKTWLHVSDDDICDMLFEILLEYFLIKKLLRAIHNDQVEY